MAAEVKAFEDKARAAFQSENEKTAEIKYKPSAALHQRTDSLQLKTLKNRDFNDGPASDRIVERPKDVVIEFREKVKISAKDHAPGHSLFKTRSLCEDDCPPTAKASKSEGKHAKVGVSL